MKNVRIIYKKFGRMRFVSHLDMNRFMSRIIHKTKLPIWYTEGFNKHPYITFALPLSLGFESDYEVMDFRIVDDDIPLENIKKAFEDVFPPYLEMVDVFYPVMKTGDVAFADFKVTFDSDNVNFYNLIQRIFSQKEIMVSKKSKKGAISEIDIAPKIKNCSINMDNNISILLTLPAGSKDNINPNMLLNYIEQQGDLPEYIVCRTALYNDKLEIFR